MESRDKHARRSVHDAYAYDGDGNHLDTATVSVAAEDQIGVACALIGVQIDDYLAAVEANGVYRDTEVAAGREDPGPVCDLIQVAIPLSVLAELGDPDEPVETVRDGDQAARRRRLLALEHGEVYDTAAAEILEDEDARVPQYAMLTAESGHDSNLNLTLHDTLAEVESCATGEANDMYVWTPQQIVDLDTGDEFDWEARIKVGRPGELRRRG